MGRGLQKLLVAAGLSNLADGVFQVALPLVTLGITRDPAAFAVVTVALKLPWLLFALPAGALADRLDRRRTMFLVNLARAVVLAVLGLGVAADLESLPLLCVVAFALGTVETLFDTAAQSIVPNLVDDDDLGRANGRIYAVEVAGNQFVGPPLGGLIVGVSAAAALFGSAAAYLLAGVALMLIAGSFRTVRDGPPTRIRHDIVEGIRYLAGQKLLRNLALLTGLANLANSAFLAVLPLYAVEPGPMGLSEPGFGLLLTAGAVGVLAGSLVAAGFERRFGRGRTLLVSFVAFGLSGAAPAITVALVPVMAILAIGGVAAMGWNIVTVSLRQRMVPDHLLGRVNAGYRLLAWGSMPVGALLGGALGDLFGVRAVFVITALGTLAGLPLLLAVALAPAGEVGDRVDVGGVAGAGDLDDEVGAPADH